MDITGNLPVTLTDTPKPARTLDIVAAEIRSFTGCMLNNMIEIGRRLVEAREMCPHGEFIAWVGENTGYSRSQANNLIRIFEEYAPQQGNLFGVNVQTFGHLPYSKALALLSVPAEEREEFAAEVGAESLSVRELKKAIADRERERDEARRESQAAQANAEELERQLDVANAAERDYKKRIEELEHAPPDPLLLAAMREEERKDAEEEVAAKLEEAERSRKAAEAAMEAAKEETEKIKAQMSALDKARQKEERDIIAAHKQDKAEAVECARKEAVAEKETELARAKAALDKAAADLQSAGETEAKLREELEKARKAASEAKPAAADKDISEFEFLFNQAKEAANKMRTIMLERRKNGDAETAQRLFGIMVALGDAIKEAVK